jgi:hypothetical protein
VLEHMMIHHYELGLPDLLKALRHHCHDVLKV